MTPTLTVQGRSGHFPPRRSSSDHFSPDHFSPDHSPREALAAPAASAPSGGPDRRIVAAGRIAVRAAGPALWAAAGAVLCLGLGGCATGPGGSRPTATGNDILAVAPGTPQADVLARFGQPFWRFQVRQNNLTILNYRLSHSECVIYQVSVQTDGTVRDVAPAFDPLCSGPG